MQSDQICGQNTTFDLYGILFNFLEYEDATPLNENTSSNCTANSQQWMPPETAEYYDVYNVGKAVFAYVTPIVICVGLTGNCLSLHIFLSQNMRGLSASTYLAAISGSDILTLIFYVTVEWLRRGIIYLNKDFQLPFLDMNGICQIQLYLSYVSRFLSVWLVVAFNVERYIGVCHPLKRRSICTKRGTRRIVLTIFIIAIVIVLYKPFLSGIYEGGSGKMYCTSSPRYDFLSFILDSGFAVLITLIPFLIITVLNSLIMRKLMVRNHRQKICKVVTEESIIKLEFTIILLAISFCFIAFNVPYFTVWCRNFLNSKYLNHSVELTSSVTIEFWQGVLNITRTIFYMNYCINFFLYSITGAYFRRELAQLFVYRSRERRLNYCRCTYSTPTPRTFV